MNVTLVTVTYGARMHLLIQALDAAKAQGVAQAVVIDNGSTDPIKETLAAKYGAWALVMNMGGNKGSAAGFAAGIHQAVSQPASYILLLDDDNVLAQNCLATLIIVFEQEAHKIPASCLLGFGFRVNRHQWMIDKCDNNEMFERQSSFRGFHVLDVGEKLRRRYGRNVNRAVEAPPPVIYIAAAAYGGMFFHKSLVGEIGLPDERFFLYEDDIEYSHRVIEKGGRIFMATAARITECDISWNHQIAASSSFARWLSHDALARRYYAFRNGAYNDFHRNQNNKLMAFFNMVFYMGILLLYALFAGRFREFCFVSQALRDGLTGRLDKRLHDEPV